MYEEKFDTHSIEFYQRKLLNLNSLVELSLLINSKLNIDNILDVVALTSMGELMSENICVFLPTIFGEFNFYLKKYKGQHSINIDMEKYVIESNSKIIDYFNENPYPIITQKLFDKDFLLEELGDIIFFEPMVISPLLIKNELNGILLLGKKLNGEEYSEDDLQYIDTLCNIAGIAIENARLYEEATYDFRTGIYLYKNFKLRAQKEFSRSIRFGQTFSLIMIDIDFFKKINDTYGHNQGDTVLTHLGKIIRETIREIDIPCRFGGEEFIILCPETNKDQALIVTQRLQKLIREYDFPAKEKPLRITASFGITEIVHKDDKNLDMIFERVDKALYASKENGRDRITVF